MPCLCASPQDYVIYALILVVLAPPCGIGALWYSLQMRRLFRSGHIVEARKHSQTSFQYIAAGSVFLIVLFIVATIFILVTHTQGSDNTTDAEQLATKSFTVEDPPENLTKFFDKSGNAVQQKNMGTANINSPHPGLRK